MSAAFYLVADERYFLGAVGTINSLRLVGHREPIYLLDCGLSERQRAALAGEATLVPTSDDRPPWLRKTIAPLAHPAEVRVLIDTDMIVTRQLGELVEAARSGAVVAFRDRQQRFCEQWAQLPGAGPARRRPYVSSGLVALGDESGARVLELVDRHRDVVDFELTYWRGNVRDYPYLYADQDVLNAVLCTGEAPLEALDQRLSATPPYRGLRLRDRRTLECAYGDGTRPFVVHQYLRKPWLEPTFDGVYSRLLRRLLSGDDVAIRVDRQQLPPWLRTGARAWVARAAIDVRDFGRWHFGDRLPAPIAQRVERARKRREEAAR